MCEKCSQKKACQEKKGIDCCICSIAQCLHDQEVCTCSDEDKYSSGLPIDSSQNWGIVGIQMRGAVF